MERYKGGRIPRGLNKDLRVLLEDHDRQLARGLQGGTVQVNLISGGRQDPGHGSAPTISYQVSDISGNWATIPPQAPGTLVIWRFPNLPTLLTDVGNLRLSNGNREVASANETVALVCDGVNWYDAASAPHYLTCPFRIVDSTDGTTVLDYVCGDTQITSYRHIVPDYDFLNAEALHYLGALASPWKGLYTWMLSTKTVYIESENGSLSAATVNNWNPSTNGQTPFSILRTTATVPSTVTGVVPWSSGGHTPMFYLINIGTNTITLANENGGSTATNRILTGSGLSVPISQNDMALLWYDPTSDRWRVLK